MVTRTRTQETGYEALARLAQKARTEGVQLRHDRLTGQYVATSGTTPGKTYAVTPHSCICKGFGRHGRCKHVAALQTALGWIARPGETPAPATLACPSCEGTGVVEHRHSKWVGGGRTGYRSEWTEPVPCDHCDGEGTVPSPVIVIGATIPAKAVA